MNKALYAKLRIPEGDLLCAVSGGADSTALLLLLRSLREKGQCGRLVAAHMNHGLRGKASDGDEAFVRDLCARLGIPLTVRRTDVEMERKKQGLGLEDCARRLRYAFLEEQRRAWRCSHICTAHTANDNLETVLLALVRGAGLRGLGGIPPQNAMVARPLLAVERAELLSLLTEWGESYREDASNADMAMRRNRLRRKVVPLLCEENPSLVTMTAHMTASLRADEDCLQELARREADMMLQESPGALRLSLKALRSLHPALRVRVLRMTAKRAGAEPSGKQSEALLRLCEPGQSGKRLTLGGGLWAAAEQDRLCIHRGGETLPPQYVPLSGDTAALSFTVRAGSIQGALRFRTRQPGDKLALPGRKGTKTLKKWMIEARIPRERRDVLCVAADDKGLVWVEDLGVAARCAPRPGEETAIFGVKKIEQERI